MATVLKTTEVVDHPVHPLPRRRMLLVLSAGRTGTVFLAHALAARFPQLDVRHEPSPARWELMIANARNEWGIGGRTLRRVFTRARQKRVEQTAVGRESLEINPLLCPLTDLLPGLPYDLHVVHVVRDPRTWCPSILTFKAAGYRRHVIDYLPFAKPYPSPRPPGWTRLNATSRALWRWRYCNEQILAIAPHCRVFATIRYEDLFGRDATLQRQAVDALLETLSLDSSEDSTWFDTSRPENVSSGSVNKVVVSEAEVQSICAPLLGRWSYAAPTT